LVLLGANPKWQKARAFRLANSNIGRQLTYRRRLRKAIVPLTEAVRLEPRDANFLAMMSAFKYDLHRYVEALQWADKALAIWPNHVFGLNMRARSLAKLGRAYEAREASKGALALNPESATSHAHGGWTHLQVGDARRAVEHFEQSVRLDPNNAASHRGLAMARRSARLGRKAAVPIGVAVVGVQVIRILATANSGAGNSPGMALGICFVGAGALGVWYWVRRRKSRQ
jgi:tetratricopeptide (TPR) repeat protein